jgi:alpha-tubulin suppressor-like RCC1 family protein
MVICVVVTGCSGTPAASTVEDIARAPSPVVDLAVGFNYACALLQNGDVWCWGSNDRAEGAGPPSSALWPLAARRVRELGPASAIATYGHATCALVSGALYCFGDNTGGKLGVPSDAACGRVPCVTKPAAVPGITNATAIAMSDYGICILRDDRSIWCVRRDVQNPGVAIVQREPAGDGAIAFALGYQHLCAIRDDRRVVCWGRNAMGAFGVPDLVSSSDQIIVPSVERAVAIRAGADSTCALSEDGTLRCWGAVDGTPITQQDAPDCYPSARCTPVPLIAGGGPYAAITMSGSYFHGYSYSDMYRGETQSCALRRRGDVTCWGREIASDRWAKSMPLPGAPSVLRVGASALCVAVSDSIYCRAMGGLLGSRPEAVKFSE